MSALVPHGFTKIPPTYSGILMKSVVAAKAVLFPEAEEKAILPREIVVNMEGEQHRVAIATGPLWNAFHNCPYGNVHRYGRLMRPKPLQKPISASNAFHNNALGYDAIILSGTVNRSRRRDGGVSASIAPTQR